MLQSIQSAMAPSPTGAMATFPKRLGEIDPDLNIQWNADLCRFVICQYTCNPLLKNAVLFVVSTDNGGFRHPDMRDIDILQASHIDKEGPKEKMRRVANHMIDEREKHRAKTKQTIREQTIDNKNQLVSAFSKAAGFKGNSAFRRIRSKIRGEVY